MQSSASGHVVGIQPSAVFSPLRHSVGPHAGTIPTGQEGHGHPVWEGELSSGASHLPYRLLPGWRGAVESFWGPLRGTVWAKAHGLAITVRMGSCGGTRTKQGRGKQDGDSEHHEEE